MPRRKRIISKTCSNENDEPLHPLTTKDVGTLLFDYGSKRKILRRFKDELVNKKYNKEDVNDSFNLWNDEDSPSPHLKNLESNLESGQPSTSKEDINGFNLVLNPIKSESMDNKKKKYIYNLLENNTLQYCPVCYKKNSSRQSSTFISHLKICASNNKLSTDQLIQAIKLQEKQTIERTAMGLPLLAKDRQSTKSTNMKKVTKNLNLQLAIALSASLNESETLNKIREAEGLLEAGLEKEALSQCRQLETYGFLSSKPIEIPKKIGSSSCQKNFKKTILFTRSQEERERIITQKIAIILVDSFTQSDIHIQTNQNLYALKSGYLQIRQNKDATLWTRSHQLNEHIEYDCYYVTSLSSFISPHKLSAGSKLKHVSHIPCRLPSQDVMNINENNLEELINIFSPEISSSGNQPFKPISAECQKSSLKKMEIQNESEFSKLARDWKCLVNKNSLSDLTIYAKYEKIIFAHKLVFHIRCRTILSEIIKENESDTCNEIIMWTDYDYESIIVFLEYIYSGQLPIISALTESQLVDLRKLSARYCVLQIIDVIDKKTLPSMFLKSDGIEVKLSKSITELKERIPMNFDESLMTEGEKNLYLLQSDLQTQTQPIASCGGSPEMFDSSDEICGKNNSNIHIESNISNSVNLKQEELSHVADVDWSPNSLNNDDIRSENDARKSLIINHVNKRLSCSPLYKKYNKKSKIIKEVDKMIFPSDERSSYSETCESSIQKKVQISHDEKESKRRQNEEFCLSLGAFEVSSQEFQFDSDCNLGKLCSENSKSDRNSTLFENIIDDKKLKNHKSPYVSPVWDGFEDMNNDFLDNCDSREFHPSPNQLNPLHLGTPNSVYERAVARKSMDDSTNFIRERLNSFAHLQSTPKRSSEETTLNQFPSRLLSDPFFDSLSVDESILNRLEVSKTQTTVRTLHVAEKTSEDIKKLKSRSKSDDVLTPVSKQITDVTPLADYSKLKSNELKRELDRYGLKSNLGRNKAKKLLRYIYDQMHPVQDHLQDWNEFSVGTKKKASNSDDSSTSTSGIDALESSFTGDDVNSLNQEISGRNQTKWSTLDAGFKILIQQDKILHQKILLYQPLWLESLRDSLKQNDVKCSMKELMNYLDEKCITFRRLQQKGKMRRKK